MPTIGRDLDILCVRHRLRIHDVILNASALERTPLMQTNRRVAHAIARASQPCVDKLDTAIARKAKGGEIARSRRRAAIKLHHAIVADLDGRLDPVGMEYRSQAG